MEDSLTKKIIDTLDLKYSTNTGFKTPHGTKITIKFIIDRVKPEWFNLEQSQKVIKDAGSFYKLVEDQLRRALPHESSKVAITREATQLGSDLDLDSYLPVVDLETGDMLLIHETKREISTFSVAVWELGISKEMKEYWRQANNYARFVYDPYDLSNFTRIPFDLGHILRVNTYIPPKWRLRPYEGDLATITCPESIHQFLVHLLPNENARKFVINWMHMALVGRCETYLVLNGKKGAGKGILSEHILKMLVGEENFIIAPETLLEGGFNSALDRRRIVLFDETKADKESKISKLKRYINETQTLEKKGIDADKLSKIYSSYAITNNNLSDLHFVWDDRRFSVPEITDTALEDVMDVDQIRDFVISLSKDKDLQHQFGHWILEKGADSDYSEFSVWRGPRFHQVVYYSLTAWQRVIVDEIMSRRETSYEIKDIRRIYKGVVGDAVGFPSSNSRIKDFLSNYRHEGIEEIGSVLEGDIIPNSNYKPLQIEDHLKDFGGML